MIYKELEILKALGLPENRYTKINLLLQVGKFPYLEYTIYDDFSVKSGKLEYTDKWEEVL